MFLSLCDFLFLSSSSSATAIARFWVEQDKKILTGSNGGEGKKWDIAAVRSHSPASYSVRRPRPPPPPPPSRPPSRPSAHPRSNADTHTGQRRERGRGRREKKGESVIASSLFLSLPTSNRLDEGRESVQERSAVLNVGLLSSSFLFV